MREPHQIRSKDYLFQSKAIDFTKWHGFFPRDIIPSDMDGFIEFNRFFLCMEFKSASVEWEEANWYSLPTGQRIGFENWVWLGQGRLTYVLCLHEKPANGEVVDSRSVISFQPMFWRDGETFLGKTWPGSKWESFVAWWRDDVLKQVAT